MSSRSPEREIQDLLQRALRWIGGARVVSAFLRLLTAVSGTLVGMGLIDWWFRANHPAYRWSLFGVLLCSVVAAISKWLVPLTHWRLTPLQVAWLVERVEPNLRGRLAAVVSWSQDESTMRSESLRAAATRDVASAVRGIRPSHWLRWEGLRQLVLLTVLAVAAALTLATVAPLSSSTALLRMVTPWQDYRWPQRYRLTFRQMPLVTPRLEPIRVVLTSDNRRLPKTLELQWRVDQRETLYQRTIEALEDSVTLTFPGVENLLEVRVTGGDGDTGWQRVKALSRPALEALTLTAEPPECWLLEPMSSDSSMRIPLGSTISIEGEADQPLVAARWHLIQADSSGEVIDLSVDGTRFFVTGEATRLERSCESVIELVSESGLSYRSEPGSLVVFVNEPPRVQLPLDELSWDGKLHLPEGVAIPLRARAVDEQPWSQVVLELLTESQGRQETEVNELWRRERSIEAEVDGEAAGWHPGVFEPKSAEFEVRWETPRLSDAGPTVQATLRWTVTDSCGEVGEATSPVLRVVSHAEYQRLLELSLREWQDDVRDAVRPLMPWQDKWADALSQRESTVMVTVVDLLRFEEAWGRVYRRALTRDSEFDLRVKQLGRWSRRVSVSNQSTQKRVAAYQSWWHEAAGLSERLEAELDTLVGEAAEVGGIVPRARWQGMVESFLTLTRGFDEWLGSEPFATQAEIWQRLAGLRDDQELVARSTSELQLRGAAPESVEALVRRQSQLASEMEHLQQEVETQLVRQDRTSVVGSPLPSLAEQTVSAWQREASRLLSVRQWASSLRAQRLALDELGEMLRRQASSQTQESDQQAWLERLENLSWQVERAGEHAEFRRLVRGAAADSVTAESEAFAQRLLDLEERLRAWAGQSPEVFGDVQELVRQAAGDVDAGHRAARDENTEALAEALKSAGERMSEANRVGSERVGTEGGQRNASKPAELRKLLQLAWVQQVQLSQDIEWLLASGDVLLLEAREHLVQRQELIGETVLVLADEATVRQSPILSARVEPLREAVAQQVERLRGSQVTADWLEASRRLETRLEQLLTSTPPRSSDESKGTSEADEGNPSGEEAGAVKPAHWEWQIGLIRESQVELLEQTRSEDERERRDEARIERLAVLQRELGLEVNSLIELARTHSASLSAPKQETLPGLPGIGSGETKPLGGAAAVEGDGASTPTDDGAGLTEGLERALDLMGEVSQRLGVYDAGEETQRLQQAIIDELTPPGSPPPDPSGAQQSTSSAGATAGAEAGVGEGQVIDAASLVPEALLEQAGVWGHLPERLEGELRANWVEQWVPGYERSSVDYFRRLGDAYREGTR